MLSGGPSLLVGAVMGVSDATILNYLCVQTSPGCFVYILRVPTALRYTLMVVATHWHSSTGSRFVFVVHKRTGLRPKARLVCGEVG